MPPSNTGNKAALITWTVVATVFGLTMAVLAVVLYAGRDDAEQRATKLRASYNGIASEPELTQSNITELKSQAGPNRSAVSLLLFRQDELANTVAGDPDFAAAQEAATAALQKVNARAEDNLSGANLTGAVDSALSRIDVLKQENQALAQSMSDVQAEMQAQQEQSQQQLAALQDQVRQARQAQQEAVASSQEIDAGKTQLVGEFDRNAEALGEGYANSIAQAEGRISDLAAQLERSQQNVKALQAKLNTRVNTEQMITSPDGTVIRSPTGGTLFINLGRNDSITTGMTFQVYDRVRGIPRMETETELPKGKGSIQVLRVLPTQAECRLVETTPGQTIREGDVVANLAYDKNVPPRFRIYGDFDLDNNGQTEPGDRERLTGLVQEFGGKTVDDVTVNTDVLVLGVEPAVPTLTPEERNDPAKVAEQFRKQQQRDAYLGVLTKAQSLNIPVLNQNQFLYYIGYFEEIRR